MINMSILTENEVMTLTMYVEALAVLSDITRNRHLQMKKANKKWQRGQSIRVTLGRSKLLMVNKRVKRLIRRLFIWKREKGRRRKTNGHSHQRWIKFMNYDQHLFGIKLERMMMMIIIIKMIREEDPSLIINHPNGVNHCKDIVCFGNNYLNRSVESTESQQTNNDHVGRQHH